MENFFVARTFCFKILIASKKKQARVKCFSIVQMCMIPRPERQLALQLVGRPTAHILCLHEIFNCKFLSSPSKLFDVRSTSSG